MAALTEEKQVEFACGLLSRCSPAQLAQVLEGIILKVGQNPDLLGKLPSVDVVISIFRKSPQAKEILLLLAQKPLLLLSSPAIAEGFVWVAFRVLPQEQLLELGIMLVEGASPELLERVISSAFKVLPQETLLDLGANLFSQASSSPELLERVISSAFKVLPQETLLDLGAKLLPQTSPALWVDTFSIVLQSSPETLDVLTRISPASDSEGHDIPGGHGVKSSHVRHIRG